MKHWRKQRSRATPAVRGVRLGLEALEDRSVPAVTVTGTIWQDAGAIGQREVDEPGLRGAVVELFGSTDATVGNADDVSLGTAVTDPQGAYTIGVRAGYQYYAKVRVPAGYAFTTQDSGPDATDSDVDATGTSALFSGAGPFALDAGVTGAATRIQVLPVSGPGLAISRATARDAAGFLYVAGNGRQMADLDPGVGTYPLTSAGQDDVLVAKYTPAGALVWARRAGGTGTDTGNGIAVDADGNVFVAGVFTGASTFVGGDGVTDLTGGSRGSSFVWKLDAAGNTDWVRAADGGEAGSSASAVAIDAAGGVFVAGFFNGTGTFDAGTGTATLDARGSLDAYLWKLDAQGNTSYVRQAGSSESVTVAAAMSAAADGSVYVSGSFLAQISLDAGSGTASLTTAGSRDAFVWKLDGGGNTVWARSGGSVDSDEAHGVAASATGVIVVGTFDGQATFGPSALSNAGATDVFVWALDDQGATQYARGAGGDGDEHAFAVAVDAAGSAYVTGQQGSLSVTYAAGTGTGTVAGNGSGVAFVWKLDAGGNTAWAQSLSTDGYTEGLGIAADGAGNAYVVGDAYGTTDFDPSGASFPITAPDGIGYLVRVAPPQPAKSVSGVVYTDADGNGSKNGNEGGLAGAVAELFSSADAVIGGSDDASLGTAVTAADGTYTLTTVAGRASGPNYYVKVRLPAGYVFTTQNFEADGVFSDVDATGTTPVFTISAVNPVVDAGVTGAAAPTQAIAIGGTGGNLGLAAARDAAGNLYAAGSFGSTTDFDPGVGGYLLTSEGGSDGFVAKYTPAGALVWARRLGGSSNDNASGLAVDAVGNVYLTGQFRTAATFAGGDGATSLTSAAEFAAYVWKLDAAGNTVWLRQGSGTGGSSGAEVALDAAGNVLVAGLFRGSATFDAGSGSAGLTSFGNDDAFVWKLDAAGNTLWARQAGGTDADSANGVAVDAVGNVAVAGSFRQTSSFDAGTGTASLTGAGFNDGFVWKLDAGGNTLWARQAGGTGSDVVESVAADASGNFYASGSFDLTASFNAGSGTASLTSAGETDAFVWKLDADGDTAWARRGGGQAGDEFGYDIAVDPAGNATVAGSIEGDATFGSTALTLAGGTDAFVWRLDPSGNTLWARAFGGVDFDEAYGVAADAAGNAYAVGYFSGTADFDPSSGTYELTATGGSNAFLVRVSAPQTTASYGGEQTNQLLTDKQTLAPFATLTVSHNETFTVHVAIVDGVRLGDFTPASVAGWQRVVNIGNIRYARTFTGSTAGADAQAAVRALVFDPKENLVPVGQTTTTSFVVRSYHAGGVVKFAGAISARVTSANDAPTGITLSASTARENAPAGTLVGLVSGTDLDVNPGLRFALINNAGGRFRLIGNRIEVAQQTPLDYEQGASHVIRLRVTDASGASFEKDITITVVNETITAQRKQYRSGTAGATFSVNAANGLLNGAISTGGRALQAQVVTSPNVGRLTLRTDGSFSLVPPSRFRGTIVFSFRIWDSKEFSANQTCSIVYG